MLTMLFLLIRATISGVFITNYGKFRDFAVKCLDFPTVIFFGVLTGFMLLYSEKKDESISEEDYETVKKKVRFGTVCLVVLCIVYVSIVSHYAYTAVRYGIVPTICSIILFGVLAGYLVYLAVTTRKIKASFLNVLRMFLLIEAAVLMPLFVLGIVLAYLKMYIGGILLGIIVLLLINGK